MSASFAWINWCCTIGRPIVSRDFAYSSAYSVAPRRRPHRGAVGAGAGLRQCVRAQPLAAREPRQVALLLLVGAGELGPERAELLHGEDQPARRADLRDLLDRDQREQRPRAEA